MGTAEPQRWRARSPTSRPSSGTKSLFNEPDHPGLLHNSYKLRGALLLRLSRGSATHLKVNCVDIQTVSVAKQDGVNWTSVIAFTVFHCGAVAAVFFFTWPAFFVALALYWISLS